MDDLAWSMLFFVAGQSIPFVQDYESMGEPGVRLLRAVPLGVVAAFDVYLSALLDSDDPFTLLPDYCGLYRIAASLQGLRTVRRANETGPVRSLLG